MASSFVDQLEQRQKALSRESGPAKQRLGRWKLALGELGIRINKWLAEPISKGVLTLTKHTMSITEEHIGTYSVTSWVVDLAGRKVSIEPVGTYVVGAFGRADMTGPAGKCVLLREKNDGHWSVMNQRNPQERVPLDKETFEKAFLAVLG